MQQRGMLTDRIKEKSLKLLGYEITTIELRLMPYIQYIMVNNHILEIVYFNKEEDEILNKWQEMKFIDINNSKISITKEFWDILSEIIYLGYVDIN